MTLQDLSLSDLIDLRDKYFSEESICKLHSHMDLLLEVQRRRNLVTAELKRREDILFFQS